MTTAIAKRISTVGSMLTQNKSQLAAALPRHITPDRMIRVALTSLRRTPKLLECDPLSICKAVMESAQLGLEPDGVLGHAYLVPFGKECQLIAGYRGLVDLCRRSGNLSTIHAEIVRDGDRFEYELGDRPFIRHWPNLDDPDRDQRPAKYVYAVAGLRDGGVQREIMSAAEIDRHRKKHSRSKKESPWDSHWPEMAKKTVLRRLIKLLPVSVEVQQVVQREELLEHGVTTYEPPTVVSGLDDLTAALTAGNGGATVEPENINDAASGPPADENGPKQTPSEEQLNEWDARIREGKDVAAVRKVIFEIEAADGMSDQAMDAWRKAADLREKELQSSRRSK